jgi:Zinc knuckle
MANSICRNCDKKGHTKKDCPDLKSGGSDHEDEEADAAKAEMPTIAITLRKRK